MNFGEALKILGIEEYSERISNSNSHGELFHLYQYYAMAEILGQTDWFADWFKIAVNHAEREWERPESVFQHIDRLLLDSFSKW